MRELSLAEQLDLFRRVQAVWASCPNEYADRPQSGSYRCLPRTRLCIARRRAARRFTKLAGKYITDNELRQQMRLPPLQRGGLIGWLARLLAEK